jgi:uncharacterized protein
MTDDLEALLADVAHRPWPLPRRPWVMAQRWNDLLFMHWPVATNELRQLVPAGLELDVHQSTAWVSITPFYLSHLRARGLPPLPIASSFLELNLRTYVSIGGKPGVFFFSLDAASALAVMGARTLFHLPYFHAAMSARHETDGTIAYRSARRSNAARLSVSYAPSGPVRLSEPGALDFWLTERYCLYAVDSKGHIYRAEIHHRRWPLQPARAELDENTLAAAAGIDLPPILPRLSFARDLDVVVWMKERVV